MKSSNPWVKLSPGDAMRVSAEGRFDFFWVLVDDGMPSLMLKLPHLPSPLPRLPKLKNLIPLFRSLPDGAAFVLGLNEANQVELFETLCQDVVSAGETANSQEEALARALLRTHRWHHLLRGGMASGLSIEEQRGLVGELAFLRELVSELGTQTAIESWMGPQGSAKDFEFIGTCIEVKTRRAAAKPFVAISSEDQLADVDGSQLFLRIVNVASAVLPEGQSLHNHVRKTSELFEADDRAFIAWEEALHAAGYDPENEYNGRRWVLGSAENYRVEGQFPRISSPLVRGVSGVRYSISIDSCEPHKFDQDLMHVIREGLLNG